MLVGVCRNIRDELLCCECQQSFSMMALKGENESTVHDNIQPLVLTVKPISLEIVVRHLARNLGHANI